MREDRAVLVVETAGGGCEPEGKSESAPTLWYNMRSSQKLSQAEEPKTYELALLAARSYCSHQEYLTGTIPTGARTKSIQERQPSGRARVTSFYSNPPDVDGFLILARKSGKCLQAVGSTEVVDRIT